MRDVYLSEDLEILYLCDIEKDIACFCIDPVELVNGNIYIYIYAVIILNLKTFNIFRPDTKSG